VLKYDTQFGKATSPHVEKWHLRSGATASKRNHIHVF